MAGLAAAHELAERGFDVTVYERKALGGKARSIPVAGTAGAGGATCPASTASGSSPASTTTSRTRCGARRSRQRERREGQPRRRPPTRSSCAPTAARTARSFGLCPDPAGALTPGGLQRTSSRRTSRARRSRRTRPAYFVERLMVFLTSCDERRYGQWEHVSWWDFVRAEQVAGVPDRPRRRPDPQPRRRQGDVASTRTIGNMAEAFVYNIMGRGNDGALDRVLDAPDQRGVDRPVGDAPARRSACGSRRPEARGARRGRRADPRRADARPPPAATRGRGRLVRLRDARRAGAQALVARRAARSTRRSRQMDDLFTDWMAGIQFYLRGRSTSPRATSPSSTPRGR